MEQKKLIYIAGPFFKPEEVARVERIEELCKKHSHLALSPRKFMVLPKDASLADRKAVFHKNVQWMHKADLILACTDDRDTGTIWEMGLGYEAKKPVVAFSEREQDKVNVMLAQACVGWIRGWESLESFLKGKTLGYAEVEETGEMWDFNWPEVHKWMREIF